MPEIKAPAARPCRLTTDFYGAKEGDTVYSYSGATYGTVNDEEERLGVPCRAVTSSPSGAPPFMVVPQSFLKSLDSLV